MKWERQPLLHLLAFVTMATANVNKVPIYKLDLKPYPLPAVFGKPVYLVCVGTKHLDWSESIIRWYYSNRQSSGANFIGGVKVGRGSYIPSIPERNQRNVTFLPGEFKYVNQLKIKTFQKENEGFYFCDGENMVSSGRVLITGEVSSDPSSKITENNLVVIGVTIGGVIVIVIMAIVVRQLFVRYKKRQTQTQHFTQLTALS